MNVQSALDRMIRILVVSIGIGSVLFSLLGLAAILEQQTFLNPVYSVAAIVFFCGLPPIMAVLSLRVSVGVLRVAAGVHAAGTLVLLVLWVPAMSDQSALAGGALPWIIATITVAATEAAIALPFLGAWIYMLVIAAVSGVVRYITFGSADASQAVQDAIMIVLISGFLMAIIQLTLLAGREQDAGALATRTIATSAAAAETLERQRARYNNLTRDDILTTLRAAMQDTPEFRGWAAGNAVQTIQKMEAYRNDVPTVASVPLAEFDFQLRTTAVANGISYASSLGAELPIPVEVADALGEAAGEAMRNSVAHAAPRDGRVVRRTVRAAAVGNAVQVIVKDDGRGFATGRIGLDRLGVRLGILDRLNSLPGGSASIDSVRGRGTTVTLEWSANA